MQFRSLVLGLLCCAAAASAQDGHVHFRACGLVDFGGNFVGVADDDEVFGRFPEAQDAVREIGVFGFLLFQLEWSAGLWHGTLEFTLEHF